VGDDFQERQISLDLPRDSVKYLSSYSKMVNLCVWILFMWYQKLKTSCLVVFRDKETFESPAAMLIRDSRTNSLTWEVMRFYPSRHFM
jgi:hypothetical protein